MQPLTKIRAVLFPPFIKLVDTLDDIFHRTAIHIDYPGKAVSMDLLLREDFKNLYHIARLNIIWTDDNKAMIDICPPNGTKIAIKRWINGEPIFDTEVKTLVALIITPEKPLEIGLEKRAWKGVKSSKNNP